MSSEEPLNEALFFELVQQLYQHDRFPVGHEDCIDLKQFDKSAEEYYSKVPTDLEKILPLVNTSRQFAFFVYAYDKKVIQTQGKSSLNLLIQFLTCLAYHIESKFANQVTEEVTGLSWRAVCQMFLDVSPCVERSLAPFPQLNEDTTTLEELGLDMVENITSPFQVAEMLKQVALGFLKDKEFYEKDPWTSMNLDLFMYLGGIRGVLLDFEEEYTSDAVSWRKLAWLLFRAVYYE